MKKLTWILCLLLSFVLVSCPAPGEDQKDNIDSSTSGSAGETVVKPDKETTVEQEGDVSGDNEQESSVDSDGGAGSGELVVTEPPGYMVLDCNPTFRTDMVRWGYAELVDGEWVKLEQNGAWNPERPDGNRYELAPGHYKLINIISDEFVDKGVGNGHGHGAYDLEHENIEFEVKPGQDITVSLVFEDYDRMPVTFKVEYDENRVVQRIVAALKVKSGSRICSVSGEYKRQSRVFTNDVERHEIIYVWDGIPLDTAEMRFSVIYTDNTSGAVPWFDFVPGKHSTVIEDVSSR